MKYVSECETSRPSRIPFINAVRNSLFIIIAPETVLHLPDDKRAVDAQLPLGVIIAAADDAKA